MPNVSRKAIHTILDQAARTIIAAGGTDGRASRADITKKLKELTGPERELVDTFYRYVDHRDATPGASVTKSDVNKALAEAKQKLIDAYDLTNNGLSPDERAKMGKVGQLAAQLAELHRIPSAAAKDALEVLVSPKWNANALPSIDPSELSPSAKRSFEARARRAVEQGDLIDAPIARKLTAGGEQFTVVAQFTHDSFAVELYNSNGRKVGTGDGWNTPEQPINWQ
jgi:hypothetical protein